MIPRQRFHSHASVPVLFAIGALAACGVEVEHHGPPPPPPAYFDYWEIEPNDAHCCPDDFGLLYVGDAFVIGGTIRDDLFDPFDGFALLSAEPLELEFILEPVDVAADLDLCVFDPFTGAFAFCFDSPASIETGRFNVPSAWTDFHLVVNSYSGDAEYRLHVYAHPLSFGALADGPERSAKPAREVPLATYLAGGGADGGLEPSDDRIVARGALYDVDLETGDIERRPWVLREDGRALVGRRR